MKKLFITNSLKLFIIFSLALMLPFFSFSSLAKYQFENSFLVAKLQLDNTPPKIKLISYSNTNNPYPKYANKTHTITARIQIIEDNISEINLDDEHIDIKVNNQIVDAKLKEVSCISEKEHIYDIKITNIYGDGKLSISFLRNTAIDTSLQTNISTTFSLDIMIDNTAPVTIFSETPFDGIATITNLQGNSDPINCIPYSIHRAKYDSTGAEALFVNNVTSLSLNIGDDTIILTDGYSKRQLIESCDATSVAGLNGTYDIFVDSENINDTSLSELTFLPATNYLGVTRTIPVGGSDGQRCYVAFDHSYEYSENSWHLKAFTHIGRAVITSGEIDALYVDAYNQNGVSTNYLSTNKDYLFGKEFDRLNVSATAHGGTFLTHIRINPGQCLSDDFQRILTLEQELVRDVITPWEDDRSSGAGSLIDSLSSVFTWLKVFLIGDDYGNTDICSSTSSNPVIPSKYTHKRRIATLRLSDDSTELMNFSNPNQSNRFYIEPMIVLDTTFGPNKAAIIPKYANTLNASELFLTYSFNSDPGVITVQIEAIGNITIGYYTGTVGTFSIPADGATIKTANAVTGTISLIGYADSRSLYPYSP